MKSERNSGDLGHRFTKYSKSEMICSLHCRSCLNACCSTRSKRSFSCSSAYIRAETSELDSTLDSRTIQDSQIKSSHATKSTFEKSEHNIIYIQYLNVIEWFLQLFLVLDDLASLSPQVRADAVAQRLQAARHSREQLVHRAEFCAAQSRHTMRASE